MSSTENNIKGLNSPQNTKPIQIPSYEIAIAPGRSEPHLCISVPVYYTQTFKTKKDKTFLVGMNWLRTAHHYIQNTVKQDYNSLLVPLLSASKFKIKGTYEVAYVYYYKNKNSDLLNVGALLSKYFLDAAQRAGVIQNDNVQYCLKEAFYVGKQDKNHPRMEIFIRPYTLKE